MGRLTEWVSTVATLLYPYGVILGFIGTVFTVVFAAVKFRSILFSIFDRQANTDRQSKAAADNSLANGDAIVLLTEALIEERRAVEASDAARDREAELQNELLARTLRTLAIYDQQHVLQRLEQLERPRGPASDDVEVITGKHRLPTSMVSIVTGEQPDAAGGS